MKSFLYISLLLIFYTTSITEEEGFKTILETYQQYHEGQPKPEEFEYVFGRINTFSSFRMDNTSTQSIDDIIKQYNLPSTMKGVLQEIYVESDSDEVYEKLINFKESLGEISVTLFYLIHFHHIDEEKNQKVVWNTFLNSTFTLLPKYESSEVKYVCNKGFMITPCKEINVINVASFLNDLDLNSIKAPGIYAAEEEFIKAIKDYYKFETINNKI